MPATHSHAGIAAWKFNLKAEIHSFNDGLDFLDGVPERELGPQMTVLSGGSKAGIGGYIAVRLYETEIIRYYPGGTFSVDNGGFNTLTTTERLNAVLPDGFQPAYHHKKQLGIGPGFAKTGLWPLDHSRRIDIKTKEIA